jgi:hypothetical protein
VHFRSRIKGSYCLERSHHASSCTILGSHKPRYYLLVPPLLLATVGAPERGGIQKGNPKPIIPMTTSYSRNNVSPPTSNMLLISGVVYFEWCRSIPHTPCVTLMPTSKLVVPGAMLRPFLISVVKESGGVTHPLYRSLKRIMENLHLGRVSWGHPKGRSICCFGYRK